MKQFSHIQRNGRGRSLPHPLDSISYSSVPARPNKNKQLQQLLQHESSLSSSSSETNFNLISSLEVQSQEEEEDSSCGLSRANNVADRRIMGGLDAGYGKDRKKTLCCCS